MDIVREDIAQQKKRRRLILAAVGVAAVLLITLGLSRLKPAAPSVDKGTVLVDVVKRGAMERQVRGPGSLVPETEGIRQVSSNTDARIERLLAQVCNPPVCCWTAAFTRLTSSTGCSVTTSRCPL